MREMMPKEKMEFKVLERFLCKGRVCVIVRVKYDLNGVPPHMKNGLIKDLERPRCNGYVEVFPAERRLSYEDYKQITVGLSFQGELDVLHGLHKDEKRTFIGFDSMSSFASRQSQSPEAAKWKCKEIVDCLDPDFVRLKWEVVRG